MDQPTKHRVSSERRWAVLTDCAIALLLCMVQIFVDPPMLIGERWMTGGGWVQIFLAALAGGWLYGRMYPLKSRNRWRRRTWLLFTCVFFGQLGLGIWVDPRFLMSGQLHLPVPDLILGGAIYRWQLGFMPMLFLVTVLLSGGAWCHQLCYFGALDAWSAGDTYRPSRLSNARRQRIRLGILTLFIGVAGGLRLWGFSPWEATLWGGGVGLLGLGVILLGSYPRRQMIHCSLYCPLGTLVSYLKELSPWRFRLTDRCTHCLHCTAHCPYGALTPADIQRGKPGRSCTLCGECLPHCPHQALTYHFPGLKTSTAEHLWMSVGITLYICFLMLARI